MAKKNVMYLLNRRGHAPLVKWNPTIEAEVKSAAEMFGQLQEQGQRLYDVSNPADTGKELTTFDPEATEIVAFGQLEGG